VNDTVENRIATLVHTLPALDRNVELLLEAAIPGRTGQIDVAQIIATDPGLCTELLFLANGACYNPDHRTGPISTIREALDRVGAETLATLAGASSALNTVSRGTGIPERPWNEYLQHSREIATVCTILAEVCGLSAQGRETYTVAGLTHDVGRIVIMAAAHDTTASFLGTTPADMVTIVENEQAAYRMDHCQIGHALFEKWGFSEWLCEGVLRHHAPLRDGTFCPPAGVIFVSHFITMPDFTGTIVAHLLPTEILRNLSLHARDLDHVRTLYAQRQTPRGPR
jgi:HD-like signal output (HDOD) protein